MTDHVQAEEAREGDREEDPSTSTSTTATAKSKANAAEAGQVKQEVEFIELSSSDEDEDPPPGGNQAGGHLGGAEGEEEEEEVPHVDNREIEMDLQVLKRLNDYLVQMELQVIEVNIEPYRSKRKSMRLTKTIVVSFKDRIRSCSGLVMGVPRSISWKSSSVIPG